MSTPDLSKVRELVQRVQTSRPFELADRRVDRWAEALRARARGQAVTLDLMREIREVISRDLMEPGRSDLVQRLWAAVEAEPAIDVLIDEVERAGEVFAMGRHWQAVFVVPVAVRVFSRTSQKWRLPLVDREGRVPLELVVSKKTGVGSVAMDPWIYGHDPLASVKPCVVRRHAQTLLQYPLSARWRVESAVTPLVEPLQLIASQDPGWELAFMVGALQVPMGTPIPIVEEGTRSWWREFLFMSELAFPLGEMRLISNSLRSDTKGLGIHRWHQGLRFGAASLRRLRLGQQQWTGDSSRHLVHGVIP